MAELPTGTVTFLFTDVEGSTRLLHELGDEYEGVLAEHRRILRHCRRAGSWGAANIWTRRSHA
jgi:class 3 adenylate cyclase